MRKHYFLGAYIWKLWPMFTSAPLPLQNPLWIRLSHIPNIQKGNISNNSRRKWGYSGLFAEGHPFPLIRLSLLYSGFPQQNSSGYLLITFPMGAHSSTINWLNEVISKKPSSLNKQHPSYYNSPTFVTAFIFAKFHRNKICSVTELQIFNILTAPYVNLIPSFRLIPFNYSRVFWECSEHIYSCLDFFSPTNYFPYPFLYFLQWVFVSNLIFTNITCVSLTSLPYFCQFQHSLLLAYPVTKFDEYKFWGFPS